MKPAPLSTRSDAPARPTSVRYGVLAVLCSLAFLTYLDRICISRAQGDIARDLNFGALDESDEAELREAGLADDPAAREKAAKDNIRERMSWVFSAFLAGYFLFEVPGGWLGDIWGARRVITRIVVCWSIFTALTGSVLALVGLVTDRPQPWMLVGTMVAVRFLFGLGEAGAFPNIARALGRWFPLGARAGAQGAIWMASRLGGALAPLVVGGLMSAAGGWRGAFWVLGAIGVVWAVLFWWWFRDRPVVKPSVNQAVADLFRGGLPAAGSIYDDAGHAGVPWLRLVLSTNLLAAYFAAAAISFSWYFYVTFLPQYLKDRFNEDFGKSEVMSGLPLLVGGAACMAGGLLSDRLIRRVGRRRGRSLIGFTGYAAAGVCTILITTLDSAWAAVGVMCVVCAFQDAAVPCIWSLPADIGGRYAGTVAGCINSMGAVGGFFSPLAAAHFANEYGWNTVFYVFAGAYFLGALAWLRIDAEESLMRSGDSAACRVNPGAND